MQTRQPLLFMLHLTKHWVLSIQDTQQLPSVRGSIAHFIPTFCMLVWSPYTLTSSFPHCACPVSRPSHIGHSRSYLCTFSRTKINCFLFFLWSHGTSNSIHLEAEHRTLLLKASSFTTANTLDHMYVSILSQYLTCQIPSAQLSRDLCVLSGLTVTHSPQNNQNTCEKQRNKNSH